MKIGIVAMSITEFDHWMREKFSRARSIRRVLKNNIWEVDGDTYFFVHNVRDLKGCRFDSLKYIGGYYQRRDLEEIREVERMEMHFKGVKYESET